MPKEIFLNKVSQNIELTDVIKDILIDAMDQIGESEITGCVNIPIYEVINDIRYLEKTDVMFKYYFRILVLLMDSRINQTIHPSFIQLLKRLTPDELKIMEDISLNNYEFISTYDLIGGRFCNYKRVRFDYPKDDLNQPLNFDVYIFNLKDCLNLIDWPIYNEEAIMEHGKQTGTTRFSRLVLTILGKKFISCFK